MTVGVKPDLQREHIRCAVVKFLLLRRAEGDIRAAAVGSPSLFIGARAEIRVGIRNSLVNFILVSVLGGAGRGIANFPKTLNKLVTRIIGRQPQKCVSLFLRNNISNVPFEPFPVVLFKFLLLSPGGGAAIERNRPEITTRAIPREKRFAILKQRK